MHDVMITSTITDPDKSPDEIEKHRAQAAEKLGPNPRQLFMDAEAYLTDIGLVEYKVISTWRAS